MSWVNGKKNQLFASRLPSIPYVAVKMNFLQKVKLSFLATLLSLVFYPSWSNVNFKLWSEIPQLSPPSTLESSCLAAPPRTRSASAIEACPQIPPVLVHPTPDLPTQCSRSRRAQKHSYPYATLLLHSDPSLSEKKMLGVTRALTQQNHHQIC